MKKPFLILLLVLTWCSYVQAQSLELMAGNQRIFVDAQWLKPIDTELQWSIFSRTRATVDYDNNTNLFTGTYFNYTTKIGLGGSVVGKIGNNGAGVDAGVHIFKNKKNWMLFGLASVGLKSKLEYSWFSIFRFTPKIGANWKLYTSLELFSLFDKNGSVFNVQRVRLGLDRKGYQFGLASNLSETVNPLVFDNNFGVFIRKSF